MPDVLSYENHRFLHFMKMKKFPIFYANESSADFNIKPDTQYDIDYTIDKAMDILKNH